MGKPTRPEAAAAQLAETQRRRLQVYVSQSTPAWSWPAFGVAVAAFFASFQVSALWVHLAATGGYGAFVAVWMAALARRSSVQPRLRGMPGPLFREVTMFWVAGVALYLTAVAVGLAISFVPAGLLAGVGTALGGRAYERRFQRRATQLLAAWW